MYALLPDLDQGLVTFLTAHPSLGALHAGRVGTVLAAGETPAVRTSSLGATQPWPWQTLAEFQVEWWGGDQGAANLLARTGEAALYDLIGPVTGGRVNGISISLSMLWSPDDQTGRARYITHFQLIAHPEGT